MKADSFEIIDHPEREETTRLQPRNGFTLAAVFTTALLMACAPAFSLGILVPREPELSAIRQSEAEVRAEIKNNIARTRVVQEFYNPNSRQLEADFLFPVPRNANVTDFVLYLNGKPVKGEVLEKEKAREIYEGIVRRMKDPGLLEWIDYNLFKVRVFPVPANGTQKIELEFAQPLESDQGMFKYTFPLKSPGGAAIEPRDGKKEQIKFSVDIISDEPVRNIYSPSHNIDTDMKDPKRAHMSMNSMSPASKGDFILFYEYSKKDVALSLLANRSGAEDGCFALMLSPQWQADPATTTPADMCFVIDTSGSMQDGNKIEQARKALSYCVSQLHEADRFNIIRFSTETERFRDTLVSASKQNVEDARNWIGKLEARGGTNISEALGTAISMAPSGDDSKTTGGAQRICTIVFITDGLPTVGVTDAGRILEEMKSKNTKNVRIFAFGVGYDVNTKLLDRLADETRASSEYIKPGQDMELPISKFFDKIARPAMTELKLDITAVDAYDMYPKQLPDLFYGTQLTIFGRYKKPGPSAIKLSGVTGGKSAECVVEKTFPEKETANEFVEKLWGTRKIAYLLDEIRAHGESPELKDEVVRLAKKYGVATPYTSFLVTEDTPIDQSRDRVLRSKADQSRDTGLHDELRMRPPPMLMPMPPASPAPAARAAGAATARLNLSAESGESAVAAASKIAYMKKASVASEEPAQQGFRSAGGKTFLLENGTWIDTDITPGIKPVLTIKYLSDAYFAALKINPALKDIFALGEKIRVKLPGCLLEIGPDGKDRLDTGDEKLLNTN